MITYCTVVGTVVDIYHGTPFPAYTVITDDSENYQNNYGATNGNIGRLLDLYKQSKSIWEAGGSI